MNMKLVPNLKGLLAKGHAMGLEIVETSVIQMPTEHNRVAVVRKTIRIEGKLYSGIGEAKSTNVDEIYSDTLISIAETRALVRALRWGTNTPDTAVEELKQSPASKKQSEYIMDLAKKKDVPVALREELATLYNAETEMFHTTARYASELIKRLKECPNDGMAA